MVRHRGPTLKFGTKSLLERVCCENRRSPLRLSAECLPPLWLGTGNLPSSSAQRVSSPARPRWPPPLGSGTRFVGRGRRAQNKRSIPLESWRRADSRNVFFLKIYLRPFLEMFVLYNSAPFPLCLRYWLWYGRNTGKWHFKRFLTSCSVTLAWLRSRASLGLSMTTYLTRARWVTAARVPLPLWRTESRPCRHSRPTPAVYGPTYLASFAQFPNKRLIPVGKFERNVKYHLSMSSKLGFRVPRWNRNDTFLRVFVKSLLFFASHRASAVGNGARDSTSWGRHLGASTRGQSVWAAAEGRGRRADLTCQTPTRAHQ